VDELPPTPVPDAPDAPEAPRPPDPPKAPEPPKPPEPVVLEALPEVLEPYAPALGVDDDRRRWPAVVRWDWPLPTPEAPVVEVPAPVAPVLRPEVEPVVGAGVVKPLALPGPDVPMPEPLVISEPLPDGPVVATPDEPEAPPAPAPAPPAPPADCAAATPPTARAPITPAKIIAFMRTLLP
jgi:hypothetical protein